MPALTLYRPSFRAAAAIAVLLAWVTSLGWLAMREFGQTAASALSSEATLHLAPRTIWYAIYDGQVQVGNGGLTLDTLSPGYRITESVMLETPQGPALSPLTRRTETWLGATLNVERVQSQFTRAAHQTDWQISIFGDTVTAHFSGAMSAQGRSEFDQAPSLPVATPYRLALGGVLQPGRQQSLLLLDGWPLAARTNSVMVGRDSMLRFVDSSRAVDGGAHWVVAHYDSSRVTSIVMNTVGGPRRIWVDPDGGVAAGETALGVRWMRTDFDLSETEFRKTLGARESGILAALPPTARYVNAAIIDTSLRTRRFVVAHRGGTPVDPQLLALFAGGRQQVHGDTIVITAIPPSGGTRSMGDTVTDLMTQSDAGAISTLATQLVGSTLVAEKLDTLIATFRDLIHVDTSRDAPADALGTLALHRGSPDGVTRLFVALLQAADLPARYVIGIYPDGDGLLTHAWAEVWDARAMNWIAADPVMRRGIANTGLIRLAMAGSSAPDQLLWQIADARLREIPAGAPP